MKIAALISVVLLLVMLGVVVTTDKREASISISERAASRRWSYLLFAGSLTTFGSLFFLYLLYYFGGQFKLPLGYYVSLCTGWLSLLLTAWIPDHGPRNFANAHWKSAFGLALSMTVMTVSIACAQRLHTSVRVLGFAITAWYCYTLYLWLFHTKAFHLYLRYELVNIIGFMGLIAVVLIFR